MCAVQMGLHILSLFYKSPCASFQNGVSCLIIDVQLSKKASEYDQEISQSQTANKPTAPRGRATEH